MENDNDFGYLFKNGDGFGGTEETLAVAISKLIEPTGKHINASGDDGGCTFRWAAWEFPDGRRRLIRYCDKEQLLIVAESLFNRLQLYEKELESARASAPKPDTADLSQSLKALELLK